MRDIKPHSVKPHSFIFKSGLTLNMCVNIIEIILFIIMLKSKERFDKFLEGLYLRRGKPSLSNLV